MGKFIKNTIVYSVAAVVSVVVGWWLSQREKEAAKVKTTHSSTRMPSPATPQAEETKIVLPPEAFENLDVSNGKQSTKSVEPKPKSEVDDLTTIKGIGPKTAEALANIDITSFASLASADAQDIKNRLEGTALSLKKIEGWIQVAKEFKHSS